MYLIDQITLVINNNGHGESFKFSPPIQVESGGLEAYKKRTLKEMREKYLDLKIQEIHLLYREKSGG